MSIKQKIEQQFQFMSLLIEDGSSQILNPAVSLWSVSQHLDHLLKAAEKILSQIVQKERRAKKKKNMLGRVLLTLGYIPRGRKSPKMVEGEAKSPVELTALLNNVKSLLEQVDFNNLEQASFDHHVFGGLNGKEWLRFMTMHNYHHEKIIKRILDLPK